MRTGRLEALWIKRVKHGSMDPVAEAELVVGRGIVGNANQGGRRQVTILDADAWESLMRVLGVALDPALRRANLLVRGVALAHTAGRVLCIGACRVRILGETKPCEQMEALRPGLLEAMSHDWSGGAFGEVLAGGVIRQGDAVAWDEGTPPTTDRGE